MACAGTGREEGTTGPPAARCRLSYDARPATTHPSPGRHGATTPVRLAPQGRLWAMVARLLREPHSPEQIAGILRNMNLDELTPRASHETIYTALYALPRSLLRAERIAGLRQPRQSRRPRARGEHRRGRIPSLVSIHDRPAEIDKRIVPGRWEDDLIKGACNASLVATLVERTSLFVTPKKMENATAEAAVTSFSTILNRIDVQRRLSMTYDLGGREMAKHEQLSEATGIKVYFADFSQAELDDIAWKMNTRPHKSLGWKCPAELFMPESFGVRQHHHEIVALGDALRAQHASVALRPCPPANFCPTPQGDLRPSPCLPT
ncbi:MAG: IS30 family transposase [Burkholderia sp.]